MQIIAGSTCLMLISTKLDIKLVESVVFSFRGEKAVSDEETVQVIWPDAAGYNEGSFTIPLKQEETTVFQCKGGQIVNIEAQINFKNMSVTKVNAGRMWVADTIATTLIDGNTATAGEAAADITLKAIDGVVIATVNGDISQEDIAAAVEEYLKGHPTESLTAEQVAEIVTEYVTAHREELKGEPGYTPVKGIDYWTEEDKESITKEVRKYIDLQIGGALDGTY